MNIYTYIKFKYLTFKRRIFTHLTHAEKGKLFVLALSHPNGDVLEIGSYLGASTTIIAEALKIRNLGEKLYCIDTWENDAMSEGKRDTYAEFLNNIKGYESIIVPVRSQSHKASKLLKHKFSMIFFDGDHSYKGVSIDWSDWSNKLLNDNIVIFHDYGWAKGVQKVILKHVEPLAVEHDNLPNLYWASIHIGK